MKKISLLAVSLLAIWALGACTKSGKKASPSADPKNDTVSMATTPPPTDPNPMRTGGPPMVMKQVMPTTDAPASSSTKVYQKVRAEHQSCAVDTDCAIVRERCFCDCGAPVNTKHRKAYYDKLRALCKGRKPTVKCKMSCRQKVTCLGGICKLTK